jgi:hypothetical protein
MDDDVRGCVISRAEGRGCVISRAEGHVTWLQDLEGAFEAAIGRCCMEYSQTNRRVVYNMSIDDANS